MQQLSIIVFGKNFNDVIEQTIANIVNALNKNKTIKYEIIIVDDGSLKSIDFSVDAYKNTKFLKHAQSKGIGDALLTGCKNAKYHNVMFVPGHNFFSETAIQNVSKLTGLAPVILGYRTGMDNRPRIKRFGAFVFRQLFRGRISHLLIDPHGLPIYPRDGVLQNLPEGTKHALHLFLLDAFTKKNLTFIQTPAPINPEYSESLRNGLEAYFTYFSNIAFVARVIISRRYEVVNSTK